MNLLQIFNSQGGCNWLQRQHLPLLQLQPPHLDLQLLATDGQEFMLVALEVWSGLLGCRLLIRGAGWGLPPRAHSLLWKKIKHFHLHLATGIWDKVWMCCLTDTNLPSCCWGVTLLGRSDRGSNWLHSQLVIWLSSWLGEADWMSLLVEASWLTQLLGEADWLSLLVEANWLSLMVEADCLLIWLSPEAQSRTATGAERS